jgi:transcriptional regulator with XRE-family HTH domain
MKNIGRNCQSLLGKRIQTLRNNAGLTQQELGEKARVSGKYIGEIERGRQNPSFNVLVNLAAALQVELVEIFRFSHEIADRQELERKLSDIINKIPDDSLKQILMLLQVAFPTL